MDHFLAFGTQRSGEDEFGGGGGESRAENVEINLNENDSAKKRMKDMPIDRLSGLPDCLLVHILSFVGMKGAAITSVLGKRWKLLWMELPTLEFRFWESIWMLQSNGRCDFVAWVHKTLANRRAKYLEKFVLQFHYNEIFASDVDNFLLVALKYKVKHICLSLTPMNHFYPLPGMMYSCSSLASLTLRGCIFAREKETKWHSLASLDIADMGLPELVLERLLSGCPVLESLVLYRCWGFTRLEINSQNLRNHTFVESDIGKRVDFYKISAPCLKSLEMQFYPSAIKLKLSNISSLVRAGFSFPFLYMSRSEHVWSYIKEIFESSQHVKELELRCIPPKDLVALLRDGWQLPKSTRKCLTISTFRKDAESIPFILGLLDSSPDLETLVIQRDVNHDRKDETWGTPARGDLGCDLQHLKTVKLHDMEEADIGGEPMLTLVQMLLKRAPSLKEMSIGVRFQDMSEHAKIITQTILSFPKSSPDALISFP